MSDIKLRGTRVLSPYEADDVEAIMRKHNMKLLSRFLLSTGFRFDEFTYILEHPESFDVKNRVIHYQAKRRWDLARRDAKDRDVYLSYMEAKSVREFLMEWWGKEIKITPWHLIHYFRRWTGGRHEDNKGYGFQTFRKTRFVWLLSTFPESTDDIIKSIDYVIRSPSDKKIIEQCTKQRIFPEDEMEYLHALLYGWKNKYSIKVEGS